MLACNGIFNFEIASQDKGCSVVYLLLLFYARLLYRTQMYVSFESMKGSFVRAVVCCCCWVFFI